MVVHSAQPHGLWDALLVVATFVQVVAGSFVALAVSSAKSLDSASSGGPIPLYVIVRGLCEDSIEEVIQKASCTRFSL